MQKKSRGWFKRRCAKSAHSKTKDLNISEKPVLVRDDRRRRDRSSRRYMYRDMDTTFVVFRKFFHFALRARAQVLVLPSGRRAAAHRDFICFVWRRRRRKFDCFYAFLLLIYFQGATTTTARPSWPVFSTHTHTVSHHRRRCCRANVIWQMFAKWFLPIFFHNPFSTASGNYFTHHMQSFKQNKNKDSCEEHTSAASVAI